MAVAPAGPGPGDVMRLWWLRLIVGIGWCIAALVILQFNDASAKTVGVIVGIMFLVSGSGIADILGFLFLAVGLVWTIEAFLVRAENSLWWIGLIAGLVMILMAFWTSGQLLIEKACVLLVFAGVWALMQGVLEIVRAFSLRAARR